VDGQPLSAADLQRLKSRRTQVAPTAPTAPRWRRPTGDWRQTLRWAFIALGTEAQNWRSAMPGLVRGDFVFTLALWVAVFSVTAAIIAVPAVPLKTRYSAGLAAVAYLYLYAELSRLRRVVPGRRVLLTVADAAVVITLGQLSVPYVGYAHLLVFFVAARIATRFRDPRVLPAGLMLLIPFDAPAAVSSLTRVLDAFAVLMVMLIVQHLQATSLEAQARLERQTWLAALFSALARARDEETVFSQLAALAAPLNPGCGWVFWTRETASDEFRAVRWSGLRSGERPVVNFSPGLAADRSDAVLITGPLPGTTTGAATLIHPVVVDGAVAALVTVGADAETFDTGTRGLIRAVAEETAVALTRLQAVDDQQARRLAMEQANRLAGLAAAHAGDQAAALDALLPALTGLLRADSIHLEWVDGDQVELVVGSQDPLASLTPESLPLAGTRTADALAQGRMLREAITGRRPEDMFCVPAGLRHMAVVPLRCAGVDGTLQVARHDVRGYSTADTLVLELLAERLALLFAAGLASGQAPSRQRFGVPA
jgi:hypothetical protein